MTNDDLKREAEDVAGHIFTMAVQWNEGQKPWDEEWLVRILLIYRDKALEEAAVKINDIGSSNATTVFYAEAIRALKSKAGERE